MPIAPLPNDTVRSITSTLALNDTASVVKELLDNALDSQADAISIEISSSTLDVIQVKDNGSGIGVEDRQLLCKRGCTSKIRTIHDLASLGGTFLGYRGEALASVAELSSAVTITTRIEGEVVGTALKFGVGGKLLSSSSASHPVGTTVRVQDFLSKIPVRQQTALKATSKTITSIRMLLQAYAFARSEVRLSFKVLKAKNEKANWAFAPRSSTSLSEVASQVAGKEVAAQCRQHTVQSDVNSEGGTFWQLDTLLVSPDLDFQKACSSDQYFSVDKRPVNADRTLMKELSQSYKRHLRNAIGQKPSSSTLSRPFVLVRIGCPPNSYDVNVEPAKDEVLFYNPKILRDLFDQLMEDVYGKIEEKAKTPSAHKNTFHSNVATASSFDLLLARKPNTKSSSPILLDNNLDTNKQSWHIANHQPATETGAHTLGGSSTGPGSKELMLRSNNVRLASTSDVGQTDGEGVKKHFNRFAVDDDESDDETDLQPNNRQTLNQDEDVKSASVANPWSLAKLNVRIPPKRLDVNGESLYSSATLASTGSGESSRTPDLTPPGRRAPSPIPALSSPEDTPFQNPGPPMRRRAARLVDGDENSIISLASDWNEAVRGKTALDSWVRSGSDATGEPPQRRQAHSSSQDEIFVHKPNSAHNRQQHLKSPTQDSPGVGLGNKTSQQHRLSLPFKTPFKRTARVQNPSPVSAVRGHPPASANRNPVVGNGNAVYDHYIASTSDKAFQTPPSSSQGELDEILEFERQKKLAIAHHRRQLADGNRNQPLTLSSPSSQTPRSGGAAIYALVRRERSSRPAPSIEATENEEDFESRFGSTPDIQAQPLQQPMRSNPHHNRYLAAARNLSRSQRDSASHSHPHPHPHSHPAPLSQSTAADSNDQLNSDDDVELPKIPDSDPRAYFINLQQQQREQDQPGRNGLIRTGLKIRRAKTMRLPLESVPVDARVHDLVVEVDSFSGKGDMKTKLAMLVKTDEYAKSGRIEVLKWSPFSKEVNEWEDRLRFLVERGYRSNLTGRRIDEDGSHTGEAGGFEFAVHLGRALKAHVDCACEGGAEW